MNYLKNLEKNLNEACEECNNYGTEKCKSRKCSIGFAQYIIQYTKESSLPVLEGGEKLIPKDDIRYYDMRNTANSVANICKLCKECNENHSEECIVSLIRRSLENTQITEQISYPGNILGYLMNVSKENPKFADFIKQEYEQLS